MNTLLLAQNTWDLTVDAIGNIAMAENPYAAAQDAASQCRLFRGELWYDQAQGIPYFEFILGRPPIPSLIKQYEQNACLLVPEVIAAICYIVDFNQRTRALSGQVQIELASGATAVIATGNLFSQGVPWYVNAASPVAAGDGGF
jgi:hypothetical protein